MSRRPSEARVAQPRKEADTSKGGAGIARGNPQPPCWGRIHSIIDVRNLVGKDFDAQDFVMYCAQKGKVGNTTLLVSPMAGFYNLEKGKENPGRTQMRIAYVESPERMKKVPKLFAELLNQYL